MSLIRVLMVAPSSVEGGQEEVMAGLVEHRDEAGIAPVVLCLEGGPLVDRLAAAGIQVEVIDAGRLRHPRAALCAIRGILRLIRSECPQLVLSNMPKAHLYAALPARARSIPALWFQATIPEPAGWMDKLATILPATAVLAPSTHAARAQATIMPHRPIRVLHPGIDLHQHRIAASTYIRDRLGLSPDTPLIGLVGRLQPWKGQREFLRAAQIVLHDHPSAQFAVVGGAILGREGNYPHELERLASELGIADHVIFTGHTREVPEWMRALDIVVNASSPEPFGLVIIEAMAAGRPVVAIGGSGGPADILEDGRTGILCPDRTPEMLAVAIQSVLSNDDLRRDIGARARTVVEERFSVQHMARAFGTIAREFASVT